MKLWLDFETFSTNSISRGRTTYMAGMRPLLLAWAIGNNPVQLHDFTTTNELPQPLHDALFDKDVNLIAFNVAFDRAVCQKVWPEMPNDLERWTDIYVQACEHGLAGSLDLVAKALAAPQQKRQTGKALISLFCIPQPDGKTFDGSTHKIEWAEFGKYCIDDVNTMRVVANMLPTHNYPDSPFEKQIEALHHAMNDKGIPIDSVFVECANVQAQLAHFVAVDKLSVLTKGAIKTPGQRVALKSYLNETYNLGLKDTTALTLETILNGDSELDPTCREILEIISEGAAAAKKYAKILETLEEPSCIKDTMVLSGAARTRRWSGRLFQPQNLKRPKLSTDEIIAFRDKILSGDGVSDEPGALKHLGDCVRSAIAAPDGEEIVSVDLAGIENRALMWLAGVEWELKAYRDKDENRSPYDAYQLTYAKAFGIDPSEVPNPSTKRFIGKVMALLLQYLGGVGGLLQGIKNNRADLNEVVASTFAAADANDLDKSARSLAWHTNNGLTYGLEPQQVQALIILRDKWRASHPEIVALGKDLEDTFKQAYLNPGMICNVTASKGKLKFQYDGVLQFMYMILPTGAKVCYYKPRVTENGISCHAISNGVIDPHVGYYAGKFLENAASGLSREILAIQMKRAYDRYGYVPSFSVHDEGIYSLPVSDTQKLANLIGCFCMPIEELPGLPLNAAGYVAPFYKKD